MAKRFFFVIVAVVALVFIGCKNISTYPISEANADNLDDRLVGKWKLEDTDQRMICTVTKRFKSCKYRLTDDDQKTHSRKKGLNLHLSKIGNSQFINIFSPEDRFDKKGYILAILEYVNADFTRMTIAIVGDTTMRHLKSQKEVYEKVEKNINNPDFYLDTLHLVKLQ